MGWRRAGKPLDRMLLDLLARLFALGLIALALVGPCEVMARTQWLIRFVMHRERPLGPIAPVAEDTALALLVVLIRIGFALVGVALFIASFKPWRRHDWE